MSTPQSACRFDGVPVLVRDATRAGFQVRDVAAGSDFVRIEQQALGLQLDWKQAEQNGATFIDAELRDTTGRDRAVTLVYAVPIAEGRRSAGWHGSTIERVRCRPDANTSTPRSSAPASAGCRAIRWPP